MNTVIVSASRCRTDDKLLGTREPFGETRSGAVDHDLALSEAVRMIATRANVGVQVIEVSELKVVIYFEYDITHVFETIPPDMIDVCNPYYGWLYTFEPNPDEVGLTIDAIVEVVFALCNTHRDICSSEVATQVAALVERSDRWQVENLRAALEYYGTLQAWRDGELVSAYNQDILNGQPWGPASKALAGFPVTPLDVAVRRTTSERDQAPGFFIRRRTSV
jgi:hypothetical protein